MLKFSCAYHKRKYYMRCMQVPTITEAKNQLGNELAEVLMDECPESLRREMRLTNPLSGPGENLWMSPSDLLIGKVVLKPPLTAKHVKALTHEGILNKGEEIEAQWLAAVELEKRLALENLEDLLMMLAERDKERAVETALQDCGDEFQRHLDKVNAEFEAVILAELAALEESLREYYNNLLDEQLRACHEEQGESLNAKIDAAVAAAVEELTAKFMQDLAQQEAELEAMFKASLDGQHERHLRALQEQEEVFAVVMKQLKHHLQCSNIASLMYMMCLERRKCMQEKHLLFDDTNLTIAEFQAENDDLKRQLHTLQCELKEKQRRLNVREDCLLGVIAQFQKFINFALRATPTQAEFLLSVEKMMTFELTQALARTQRGRKPHLAKMFMPWMKVSEESLSAPPSMSIPYHDCLNELDPPKCKTGDDELLAMIYQKRTYIREDFRNAVTQGAYSRPGTNALWSKDIEDLIKLVEGVDEEAPPSTTEEPTASAEKAQPNESSGAVDSVKFINVMEHAATGLLAVQDSVSMLHRSQDSGPPHAANDEEDLWTKPSGVAMLATNDSVSLTKEKLASVTPIKPTDEIELEVVQGPSTATFQLKRPATRHSTLVEPTGSSRGVSEVSLKLNLHKPPRDSSRQLRTPQSRRVSTSKTPSRRASASPSQQVAPRKITLHRDSLDLVKGGSSRHLQKLKSIVIPTEEINAEFPTQQYAINVLPESRDFHEVNFKRVAQVFDDLYRPAKPWKIYQARTVAPPVQQAAPKRAAVSFLDQKPAAKVLGDPGTEVNRTQKDFTIHRIHSIIDVLKKDDSLIRLFTKCTQ